MREDSAMLAIAVVLVGGIIVFIASLPGEGALAAYNECAFQRKLDLRLGEPARSCRAPSWMQDDLPASVGRNAKRQDPEEGLGPKDEHAVPPTAADAQNLTGSTS